jgi:hypothetical protein
VVNKIAATWMNTNSVVTAGDASVVEAVFEVLYEEPDGCM